MKHKVTVQENQSHISSSSNSSSLLFNRNHDLSLTVYSLAPYMKCIPNNHIFKSQIMANVEQVTVNVFACYLLPLVTVNIHRSSSIYSVLYQKLKVVMSILHSSNNLQTNLIKIQCTISETTKWNRWQFCELSHVSVCSYWAAAEWFESLWTCDASFVTETQSLKEHSLELGAGYMEFIE